MSKHQRTQHRCAHALRARSFVTCSSCMWAEGSLDCYSRHTHICMHMLMSPVAGACMGCRTRGSLPSACLRACASTPISGHVQAHSSLYAAVLPCPWQTPTHAATRTSQPSTSTLLVLSMQGQSMPLHLPGVDTMQLILSPYKYYSSSPSHSPPAARGSV